MKIIFLILIPRGLVNGVGGAGGQGRSQYRATAYRDGDDGDERQVEGVFKHASFGVMRLGVLFPL